MDAGIKRAIEDTRNSARKSGETQEAICVSGGHEYTIKATPVKGRIFYKETRIEISSKTLYGRECKTKFVYNRGQGVGQGFINHLLAGISSEMDFLLKPITIDITQAGISKRASDSLQLLERTERFVLENNLTKDEMLSLKRDLRKLCNSPIFSCNQGSYSINELDGCDTSRPIFRNTALAAESLEILLDAKLCGNVNLQNNTPPSVGSAGKGAFNTVMIAHRKPPAGGRNASDPIAIKPCNFSRRASEEFATAMKITSNLIGTASGTYRRNKAATGIQNMLCAIGQKRGITVPKVIASVSAAEIDGVPCIAMEMLNGETLYTNARSGKITANNEFIRRETWMQLQDILTGQIDRHGNNVMLTEGGPVAIDHDLSFPTNPPRNFAAQVPQVLAKEVREGVDLAVDNESPRNYCMPPLIDREMYDVIMSIDLRALENMYNEHGLTRYEICAAMNRAVELQRIAQTMMTLNRVIEPTKWEAYNQYCGHLNSYAARHYSCK
jgi:hypothetical protein